MDVTIYGCRSRDLLLVPSCLLPSLEAQQRHGPLLPRGTFRLNDSLADDWQSIAAEIDRHSYAVINLSRARQLLGQHPVLDASTLAASGRQ